MSDTSQSVLIQQAYDKANAAYQSEKEKAKQAEQYQALIRKMINHLEDCSDTFTPDDPLLAELRASLGHDATCASLCTDWSEDDTGCHKPHDCWCPDGALSFAEFQAKQSTHP